MRTVAASGTRLKIWVVPLFVVALTACITSSLFKSYLISRVADGNVISALEKQTDRATVGWDEFCYIPRMNAVANGQPFSDPWNSHNPAYRGWGTFGLLPALVGGACVYLFGAFFLSMTVWGLVNFPLIILLSYFIFRSAPISCSPAASIVGTFLLMSQLWFASQPLSWFWNVSPKYLLLGWHPSLVDIEAGLLTYLPYFLFLYAYWKTVAAPGRKKAIVLGFTAGILTYVYFYHYIFAFAMLTGHLIVAVVFKRRKEAGFYLLALTTGLLTAAPFFINTLSFIQRSATILYQQRLDYSPGRWPINDYHWLLSLFLPLVVGIIYYVFRQPSRSKKVYLECLAVLGFSYFGVLHVRVLLGFMQAPDHFWRLSLGIPASLWCLAATADFIHSRMTAHRWHRQIITVAATVLPFLLLARTTMGLGFYANLPDRQMLFSGEQIRMLDNLNAFDKVLKPGEGFLTSEPALNYHVMANLKAKPFMAMGLSPVSIRSLSERFFVSTYLTGREKAPFLLGLNRTGNAYIHVKDPDLYLYINLFIHPWSKRILQTEENHYASLQPETVDWGAQMEALASVTTIYINKQDLNAALPRIRRFFDISETVINPSGVIYRVAIKRTNP
ncbi:MAG: hypothetical protein ABIL58_14520 [Pseudomonadota bacterium]